MSAPLLLAIGTLICYGISDFVYKRAAVAGVVTHQLMMVQSSLYGIIVLVYGVATNTLVLNLPSLWGVVAALFAFTGFYNFAKSLQLGSVSTIAPIFRLSFTISAALAVAFLGEALTLPKLVGLLLAPIAIWLLLAGPAPAKAIDPKARRTAILRVIIATCGVGIANFIYKIGLQAGATPAALLVTQAGAVITMSTTMVLAWDGRLPTSGVTWRHAAVSAALLATGFVLLFEALARGEVSIVVPVAQMGFIVTALLGVALMREALIGRKVLGIAVALAALVSLALS